MRKITHTVHFVRVQASKVPNTGMALTMVTSINLLLYVLLFVLFMIFFGYPSIVQYQKEETIIISTEKKTNGIEAPAVTILTLNNITGYKGGIKCGKRGRGFLDSEGSH